MTVGELDTIAPLRHNIDVLIPLDGITLEGYLSVPKEPSGIVLFAHGSGSSRNSPRNHYVADWLDRHRLATLLTDLLTPEEERQDAVTRRFRFDIGLLAQRLSGIVEWIQRHEEIGELPIGVFGSSTGAAAALLTAAQYPDAVRAVVSRGGRPDLAAEFLNQVTAPVLLIAGGNDPAVLRLNKMALAQLNRRSHMEVIPEATHLFEEPGALKQVAALASSWFKHHCRKETGYD